MRLWVAIAVAATVIVMGIVAIKVTAMVTVAVTAMFTVAVTLKIGLGLAP